MRCLLFVHRVGDRVTLASARFGDLGLGAVEDADTTKNIVGAADTIGTATQS